MLYVSLVVKYSNAEWSIKTDTLGYNCGMTSQTLTSFSLA